MKIQELIKNPSAEAIRQFCADNSGFSNRFFLPDNFSGSDVECRAVVQQFLDEEIELVERDIRDKKYDIALLQERISGAEASRKAYAAHPALLKQIEDKFRENVSALTRVEAAFEENKALLSELFKLKG